MSDDRTLLVGKWTVWVKNWVWEYEFFAGGRVTWRDTRSPEKGAGWWSMTSSLVNIWWSDSSTKESWQLPLSPLNNRRTWYTSPYYGGAYSIEKKIEVNLPQVSTPDTEIEIDTGDPAGEPNYIDNLATHVAYGIYNGGFWVYVNPAYTPYPIEIPENLVWFQNSGERVSSDTYQDQRAGLAAAGGANPHRYSFYEGVGGKILCPTAFTYKSAPTIVNTASIVVDTLVAEVTEELKDIMIVTALNVVVSMGGALISRALKVRRLKAREARAKIALENARARAKLRAAPTTIRPRATPEKLREMLKEPQEWFVWATSEEGIIENQAIVFKGTTNPHANEQIHLLRGNDGIRGLKYGQNKVAIRQGSRYIKHFTGNEYMVDEIPASEGFHFRHSDLEGL